MRRTVPIVVLLILAWPSFSQDNLSYAEQLQTIEDEMDSLSIFNLIDSLFDYNIQPISEVSVRFGYTTSVTSAGRDFDINQSGYTPGISYFHKSGFFGDLAGFYNNGVEPNYNPTILSGGYIGSFKNEKWGYTLDAEKWFYNPQDSSDNPLTYSVGGSLSYDFKWGFASADYSFLFGQETANRIIGNISGNISLGKWWIFDQVSLYPTANIMIGNSNVTLTRITTQQLQEEVAERLSRITSFADLNDNQKEFIIERIDEAFVTGEITLIQYNKLIRYIEFSEGLEEDELEALRKAVRDGVEDVDYFDSNEFGILNYAFTLPISFSTERVFLMLSYTYSIPVQFQDEVIDVDPVGYFGASITYLIPFI
mgnify:CR=1 FL=1